MEKNKNEIISRLKEIRDIVKNDPEKRRSLFSEFYTLMTSLKILDPDNEELNIAISGYPFNAGLKGGKIKWNGVKWNLVLYLVCH